MTITKLCDVGDPVRPEDHAIFLAGPIERVDPNALQRQLPQPCQAVDAMTTTSWNKRVLPLLKQHHQAYRSLTRLCDRLERELSRAAEQVSGLRAGDVLKVLKPVEVLEGGCPLPVGSVIDIVGVEFLTVEQVRRKRPKLVVRFTVPPLIIPVSTLLTDAPVYALYGTPVDIPKHLEKVGSLLK